MPAKKQITKEMILDAALKLLMKYGYEAVNIKQLASELKCSTQPVYLSFSGMDELREALTPLAVAEFERLMELESGDGRVRLYSLEYVHMAKNEPRLFRYLFMRANAFAEIRSMLMPIIEQSINELMDMYHISHEEADYLHDNLWMHAHGIASMVATDFCDWDMNKIDKMLNDCRASFTKGCEA